MRSEVFFFFFFHKKNSTLPSLEWLFVRENNRIFVVLRASEGSRRTYGKCFRIVLLRKCGSFQKRRDRRTNTHFLFSIWTGSALGAPLLPHIYTGVGYCIVYFRLGSTTTFLEVNEIDSTLSFFYTPRSFAESEGRKMLFSHEKVFTLVLHRAPFE